MSHQNTIFSLFGGYEKTTDTYKDANGKGVLERFNEVIGKDLDNVEIAINGMVSHYLNIYEADPFVLKLICADNGIPYELVYAGSSVDTIRRIAKYAKQIIEWRGSLYGTKLITYLILPPTSVEVQEDFSEFTFDSETTFDSPQRSLDSGSLFARLLFKYTNTSTLTSEEKETLKRITNYNTPFDCISQTMLNGSII